MMTTDASSELIKLCGKTRDNTILPDELKHLESLLMTDPGALRFYRQFMSVCSGLEQISQSDSLQGQQTEQDGSAEFDWTDDLSNLTPVSDFTQLSQVEPLPSSVRPHPSTDDRSYRTTTIVGVVATLAASILIASTMLRSGPSPEGFASLVDSYQADWDGDGPKGRLNGDYTLRGGAARLRFDSGAELLVQAPAAFSIDDAGLASLNQGSVRLYVPPAATGFQIKTPYGLVIDRGTRIGVFANSKLGLEVHVFEGKAEAIRKSGKTSRDNGTPSDPTSVDDSTTSGEMLIAGEAIAIPVARSVAAKRMPAKEAYFADSSNNFISLPVVSGDIELLVSPPRAVRRIDSELVDLGRATLLPERTGLVIAEDLPVSLTKSGKAERLEILDETVPAGTSVDTMLVHFAVPSGQRRGNDWLHASGEIQFPRPIVGLVCEQPGKQSDLLGSPDTDYPRDGDTGLEDSIDSDAQKADRIELSEDRLTLRFSLNVHGREAAEQADFVDQLRVLIQAAPK